MSMKSVAAGLAMICVCSLGSTRNASAGAAEAASAQVLFEEGKRLAAASSFEAACPKFAESQRLDPAAGTLIHLANCYEKVGKTASAWATFLDAVGAARQQSRSDWAELARTRADALLPRLSRLTIAIREPPSTPGLIVKRDGTLFAEPSLGTAFPVDPGPHTIELSAPGKKSKIIAIVVRDGEQATVPLPLLEPEPEAGAGGGAPRGVSHDDRGAGSNSATLGYVLGGVGLLGIGVGSVTGLVALGKNNDAKALCPAPGRCASREGVDANDSAQSLGTVSTIAFVAGGLGLATGAVLVLTSRRTPNTARVEVTPLLGQTNGLLVGGAF